MRVRLDNSLFLTTAVVSQLPLLELFSLARDERHLILSDPLFDASARAPINQWLDQQEEQVQREVSALLNLSIDAAPALAHGTLDVTVTARASNWPARELSLLDAVELLREPLHILLENGRNDFVFLRCVAPRTHRERLDEAIARAGGPW